MWRNVNEWQDMSLKKEVNAISRELRKNKSFEKPLILEMFITIILLVVDKAFDYTSGFECVQRIILLLLSAVALAIFLWAVLRQFYEWFSTLNKIKNSKIKAKPYIDLFDNEICYYALTASNFYENLFCYMRQATLSDTEKENSSYAEKCTFYYIETNYYINKCICELDKLENISDSVFTSHANDVIYRSRIHFSRLQNIIDLLITIRKDLYSLSDIQKDDETNQISKEYDGIMRTFVSKMNKKCQNSYVFNWL